jgi:hypothetical protein
MDSCEQENPIPVSVQIEMVLLARGATARHDVWFMELAVCVNNILTTEFASNSNNMRTKQILLKFKGDCVSF